jgi:hypothetical protein
MRARVTSEYDIVSRLWPRGAGNVSDGSHRTVVTEFFPPTKQSSRSCEIDHRLPFSTGVRLEPQIIVWVRQMKDEYEYLRGQYEEILRHCDYLLRNSGDPTILARANESKQKASAELARLNRQLLAIPSTVA